MMTRHDRVAEATHPLEIDVPHWRRLSKRASQRYLLYVPSGPVGNAPVLVAVHGISRNAAQMIRAFSAEARRRGVVIVAPYFGRRRFSDYQRLNRQGRGRRADRALFEILDEVAHLLGRRIERFNLFGYSGGGQFAHRFSFLHPQRVNAMVVGAAGWYTLPNPAYRYPMGIDSNPALGEVRFRLPDLIKVPALVVVGDEDVTRGPELRQGLEVNLRQGLDRVARARTWVAEMRRAAGVWGISPRHELMLLPGVGHDFDACVQVPGMVPAVFDFMEAAAGLRAVASEAEEIC